MSAAGPPRLTLYGRPGCHLCEQALQVLLDLREGIAFEIREQDISADDALLAAYFDRIPVIEVDGVQLCEGFVDEDTVRAALLQRSRGEARVDLRLASSRVTAMAKGQLIANGARAEHDGDLSAGERLSLGVAARLSRYLQVLTQAKKMGKETISSQELSDYTHVNSTQIRRDLSGFGKFGKRGVGYNVESLVSQIRKILRTAGQHNIALLGAGHLGKAIASSDIFADHGFRVVAIFDADPAKVGSQVGNQRVRDIEDLSKVVEEEEIVVGVLAVPGAAAQGLADELVDAGVKIIFNYSDALLAVPPEVTVHTSSPAVDLLYALYFYLT